MAINFTGDPYYDDFDPTKNFHRILFKPGSAVQARELTQSQTILQDQISKFGNGVFQDGSKVSGGNITVDTNVVTCKLSTDATTIISNLVGLFAVGQTSNFIAQVNNVDASNLYILTKPVNVASKLSLNRIAFSSGETIYFYNTKIEAFTSLNTAVTPAYTVTAKTSNVIARNSSGTYLEKILNISTGNINRGDTIFISEINYKGKVVDITDSTHLILDRPLTKNISNSLTQITNQISVNALEVNVDDGVWFTNGFFVANYKNSIVPDPLTTNPSAVIGFEVDEYIVDSAGDVSLLDPAIGASNYQAPGANRYKISLNLVIKPYVNDQIVTNLTNNKFIELVRINAGVIEDINNVPILTDVSSAIATAVSDISGDFIVNPFSLLVGNTSNTKSDLILSSITAGKAYISGYPIEHISQTPYYLEKSRSINTLFNQDIETYYGDYTRVKNLNGSIIDFQTNALVELHNVASASASLSSKIGTARVRNFSYDSGNLSTTQYKLFLLDINLVNNPFANVASIVLPNGSNYSTPLFSVDTVSPVTLVDNTYNSLIFPLPQTNISNVSSVNYVTTRKYSSQSFSSGVGLITATKDYEQFHAGSGSIAPSLKQQNFIVVTKSASGGYPAGHFVPMDQSNVSITVTNSPGTPQASINIAGNFTGTADVYAAISVTNDTQKTKILHTNYAVNVSANTTLTSIDLGKSDIYNFSGVYELGNTHPYQGVWSNTTSYSTNDSVVYDDGSVYISLNNSNINQQPNTATSNWSSVTNSLINYTTDNGQKDAYYDHGTITNVSGVSKGQVVAVFDYFTHSGGYGYFSVNSYPVNYDSIPSFTSPQYGAIYPLRDVLDFRPRRTDNNTTFDSYQLPAPFNNTFVNYGYYLSRIDKIVLYPNGKFKTITGVPAYTNPVAPSDIPGTLTIFTIYFPAYTYTKESVQVTPSNLRRYTMRDIGVLDKRISNLELYTSLSLLENQVTGSDVTDSTGQNLLFKNGYLVDGFTGSSVADVKNPDYAASIDGIAHLVRPAFFSNVASYHVDTSDKFVIPASPTTGKTNDKLSLTNNIVTFSYDEVSLVYQNIASQVISVNPFNVISFTGAVTLSPSSDVWYSTQSQPNISIVTDDQAAWVAAVGGTGNGSQWNDWQLNWTGQPTDTVISSADQASITRDTSIISNAIQTQGLNSAVNGGTIQVSSTTQIISNAVIPYARSIPVQFTINGLAPFTQIHTFLNGNGVDSYVTPDVGSTDTINYITIVNPGSGYTDGNFQSIIEIDGPSTIQAIATANVSGGQIVSVNIPRFGSGYRTLPTIRVTGSGVGAVLTANGAGYMGGNLVTDINGSASGTIMIPDNDYLKIPTGTILVEFADNFLSPSISNVYAKTTFASQGTLQTTQTTVISTRPPIVSPKPQVVNRTQTPVATTSSTPVVASGITTGSDGGASVGTTPLPDYGLHGFSYETGDGAYVPVGGAQAYQYVNNVAANNGWNPTDPNVAADVTQTVIGVDNSLGAVFGPDSIPASVAEQAVNAIAAETRSSGCFAQSLCNVTSWISDHSDAAVQAAADVLAAGGTVAEAGAAGDLVDSGGPQDPLSQNFYVDGSKYPNGLFVSSVDLFFATVDPTIPVNVRIRPTVNGYPDAVNDIPGSIVWKNPGDVNIPDPANITNGIGSTTTFTFDHPIYLQPGQYSIMIAANSNAYTLYASKLGQVQFGTTNVINAINYAASLFKSQNSSTWVAAPGETLCFNLKICDFAGGSATFKVPSNASSTAIQYDLMHLITSDLTFNSLDSISYSVQVKDLASSSNSTYSLLEGQTYQFPTRKNQNIGGDTVILPTMTNTDRWTSPVLDLERLNSVLIQNIITPYVVNSTPPYYSANTASEVLGGFGQGNAAARYITRRVTLNNNFVSTGLTIYLDVNRQPGTKIEVYYKILNQYDKNNFDAQPYVLMNPILTPGAGLPFTGPTDYVSDTYQALNITYNDIVTGSTYTNFNVFAIKVCFYSDNPAIAPQIKNFRAIATA